MPLRLWERPDPVTRIVMEDATYVIDDIHKIVLIYSHDAGLPSDAYDLNLAAHFEKRGYAIYASTAPVQAIGPQLVQPQAMRTNGQ